MQLRQMLSCEEGSAAVAADLPGGETAGWTVAGRAQGRLRAGGDKRLLRLLGIRDRMQPGARAGWGGRAVVGVSFDLAGSFSMSYIHNVDCTLPDRQRRMIGENGPP